MNFSFKIINKEYIEEVVSLVYLLNEGRISETILKERFNEMFGQNYECVGVFSGEKIIGVSGLWFFTRHYTGKCVELDHVYIDEAYRNHGLGKKLMKWINNYCKTKGCQSMELNTYVSNYPSHKFYYNEDMEIWGYHFFKHL